MSIVEEGKGQTPEWKAPQREYGGEDLQAYYSEMLANDTVAKLIVDAFQRDSSIIERLDQLPTMRGFKEKVEDPCKDLHNRLKEKGLYFYKTGGSVFTDYKILWTKARRKVGEGFGETDPDKAVTKGYFYFCDQFSLDTPIDAILAKAREFVSTWEWSE